MHKLYELKEKLISEMENYADRNNLSKDDVMFVKYLSSSADHICNIIEACEEDDYSNRAYSRRRYMDDHSYARKRDAMGRYSRTDNFVDEFRELIDNAPNDHIRQRMQTIMSEM